MSDDKQARRNSIVESAMARAAKADAASPSQKSVLIDSLIDPPHDHDASTPYRATTVPTQSIPSSRLPPHRTEPSAPTARRGVLSSGFLVVSHVFAAAAGAAVTWYATGETAHEALAAPPAAQVEKAAAPSIAPRQQATAELTPKPLPAVSPQVSVEKQIRDVLEQWRQSWSNRDVDAYLHFYSAGFAAADGTARSVWADGRRQNLRRRSSINVQLHDVVVLPIDSHQVKVTLLQDYASDSYAETRQPKTFLFTREDRDWRIAREWEGFRSLPQEIR